MLELVKKFVWWVGGGVYTYFSVLLWSKPGPLPFFLLLQSRVTIITTVLSSIAIFAWGVTFMLNYCLPILFVTLV
jgi:hypothetical protein